MLNKKTMLVLVAGVTLLAAGTAWAKVSSGEAEKLKSELTPFGAERAGNADGTIPAWDGGLKCAPEGVHFKGAGDFHPDPFKNDEVQFSITAKNLDQYAAKVPKGVAALLKKYPEMRLDVYPTRRTASAPQEIYDNTFRNATLCDVTGDKNGVIANGGYAGIPFPIPQNGNEAMFNHLLRWRGTGMEGEFRQANGQPNGTITRGGGGITVEKFPWYDPKVNPEDFNGIYYQIFVQYQYPARRKGEVLLVVDPLNMSSDPRKAWQYLPGQRRVRRAPSVAYDTPNPAASGLANYDDVFVFNGALDRYDWKIVGKKEMYIPYNNYAFDLVSEKALMSPKFPNPEYVRWELHRVWEIEATLKDGKRHSYAKRTFYLDEDTWTAVGQDAYDSKGNLWRVSVGTMKNVYELPAVVQRSYIAWDLTREDYTVGYMVNGAKKHLVYQSSVEQKHFTPENVRRVGRR